MTYLHRFALTVALVLLNGCDTAPLPEHGYLVGDWVATSVRDGQGQALDLADGSKYLIEISRGWLRLYEVGGKNEKMLGNSQPYQLNNNRITIEAAGKGTSAYQAKVHTLNSKELVLKNFRIDAKQVHSEIRLKRIEPKVALSLYNGKRKQPADKNKDDKETDDKEKDGKSESKPGTDTTNKTEPKRDAKAAPKVSLSAENLVGLWFFKGLIVDGKAYNRGDQLPGGDPVDTMAHGHEFTKDGKWAEYIDTDPADLLPFTVAGNKLELDGTVYEVKAFDAANNSMILVAPQTEEPSPSDHTMYEVYERIGMRRALTLFGENDSFIEHHAGQLLSGYWISHSYVHKGKEYKYGEEQDDKRKLKVAPGSLVLHIKDGTLQCYYYDGNFRACNSAGYVAFELKGATMVTSNSVIEFTYSPAGISGKLETLITSPFIMKGPEYESIIFKRATKEEAAVAIGANPNYTPE